MPSNTRRLRKMIDELKSRGVGLDEIARRTGIPRGNIFKFSQGDHRQLADSYGAIETVYKKVLGHPPPEQ